ncbi:hypothetical protein WCE00_01830 [Acinetobacter haemolyticus]|uniref:hypothetical protein n=1 Tax=Acinetobacter haemolyticus TaxID=29430 RepID=UPI0034D72B87
MAYYSGVVTSYQELLDVLVAACVAEGWTWADSILNKGTAYLKLSNQTGSYPGVVAQGGTGKSSGTLVNPSDQMPRLGRPVALGTGNNSNVTWPAQYYIHIYENPNEVYLVLHHSVDAFWKLAFGLSDLDGSGLWITGTAGYGGPTQNSSAQGSFAATLTGGAGALATGIPFWQSSSNSNNVENILFRDGSWLYSGSTFHAVLAIAPLFARLPNSWNQESILIPILAYESVASSKISLRLQLNNARYIRVDNYEPNQILTLGNEKWKIYPGVRKDIVNRDSGSGGRDNTGTFGIAIRYDGP